MVLLHVTVNKFGITAMPTSTTRWPLPLFCCDVLELRVINTVPIYYSGRAQRTLITISSLLVQVMLFCS